MIMGTDLKSVPISRRNREGGIPFFIVALVLLAPVLYFLRKGETGKYFED
jgi:hypothetical protein